MATASRQPLGEEPILQGSSLELFHIRIEEAVLVHLREQFRPQGVVRDLERGKFIHREADFLYAKAHLRVWR